MKKDIVARLAAAGLCASVVIDGTAVAQASEPPVYTSMFSNLGADGYDVVAYFTSGKAQEGEKRHTVEHQGITYRFASAANRDAFVAAPERYLPQYGGYCAWAVANGYTASADPEAFTVVGGKLYLNYSKSVQSQWEKNIRGNVVSGDRNWPKVLE